MRQCNASDDPSRFDPMADTLSGVHVEHLQDAERPDQILERAVPSTWSLRAPSSLARWSVFRS